jgi:GT2 family glycosyltransferase
MTFAGMTRDVRISVVVPTYQRCASVRRTLEALARQTLPASEYEVIVPIDGSDDGTKEMIERLRTPHRLSTIWQPNQGRAAARNAGLRLAKGNLIVFLDDDMEPVPDFLQAHFDAHPPGSRRAVVGPVPILPDSSSPPIVHYRRSGIDALLDRLAQPGYKLGFRDVYTGNLSLSREVLREVGGLDETFKLYGNEDYELALRLMKVGVELAYIPQAVAYQRYDKDFAALARDSIDRGHTAVMFARKHPDVASGLKLTTYHEGSRKWRLVRSLMLWLSRWLPRFPDWLIGCMHWLEQRRPRRLHHYYTLALDYFFWVGAKSALRERRSPDFRRTVPARIAFVLLVLFAVASSVRLLARAFRSLPAVARPDEITSYEARFGQLREILPPRARVGYVTDRQPQGVEGDEGPRLAFKRYLLTQYALLPAIVLPDDGAPLVVGNFSAANGVDSAATRDLTLVRDFGDGVMLFRASAQ